MAPAKITLYVDTHDPVFAKCEITYVPIFLGGVMKACGNIAPINIKNKDKWINVERNRWARLFSIPMTESIPEGFPPLTLTIMRALCALTVIHPGKEGQGLLIAALDELYRAFWVEHRKTNEKDVLAGILEKILGADETKKVMEMVGKEGKEVLAKNTDKAFADGAFGLPWFVVTNGRGETDSFWGVDHLGQLTEFLDLEKPKTGGWKALL